MKLPSRVQALLVTSLFASSASEAAFRGIHIGRLQADGIVEDPKGLIAPAELAQEEEQEVHKSNLVTKSHHEHQKKEDPKWLHPDHHGHGEEAAHEHHGHHGAHGEEAAHGAHHGAHGEEAHSPHGDLHERHHANESFSLACFLMGGVAALMMVFYLVNSPNREIKAATWSVLNMTTSIFVAVLIYGTVKASLIHLFEPSFYGMVVIVLTLFITCYVGLHVLLYKLKEGDKLDLQSAATLMAHITGFAAMYGFADSVELPFIEELDIHGIVLLLVGAGGGIAALSILMSNLMKKYADADGVQDEDEERWIETCEETDEDVFCLAVSFLVVLFFRFLIRGKVLPYEPGKVGDVSQHETNQLLCVGMGFAVLVIIVGSKLVKSGDTMANPLAARALSVWHHLNSTTMAWLILFWAEWQLYVTGWEATVIGGCLVVAVCLTGFSFATVVLLGSYMSKHNVDKSSKRAIKSLELALGVLVGFSWERAFDVGFEELEHRCESHGLSHHAGFFVLTGLSLVLLVIVAPAWRLYILPVAARLETSVKESPRGA